MQSLRRKKKEIGIEEVNESKTNESELIICRFCHQEKKDNEILIAPCRCAGTLQHIHLNCLEMWFNGGIGNIKTCEICKSDYVNIDIKKVAPTFFEAIWQIDLTRELFFYFFWRFFLLFLNFSIIIYLELYVVEIVKVSHIQGKKLITLLCGASLSLVIVASELFHTIVMKRAELPSRYEVSYNS